MVVFQESESDGQEFVVDTLRNFEPMQGMEVRSDVVMLRNSADDPSEVVLDVLKASVLLLPFLILPFPLSRLHFPSFHPFSYPGQRGYLTLEPYLAESAIAKSEVSKLKRR